ncbi:MAG: response regulator transcription factor [Williamsia sp.]|nr:response regulator transcription factor [Williamsia sp.]
MKTIEVLILEDHAAEAAYLKDSLLQLGYEVPAVATSLSEGLDYFSLYQPDIALVDIYLNGKPDGVLFGKEISSKKEMKKPFLFVTSAIENDTFKLAKTANPYNYLIKPFNKPELQFSIELALERYQTEIAATEVSSKPSTFPESVFVKKGTTLVSVQFDDIKYIEVEGRYCKIFCSDQRFVVQQSLADLYGFLPPEQFVRIHRRYVINAKEIAEINTQTHEVFFRDGNTLFFSHRHFDEFISNFKLLK